MPNDNTFDRDVDMLVQAVKAMEESMRRTTNNTAEANKEFKDLLAGVLPAVREAADQIDELAEKQKAQDARIDELEQRLRLFLTDEGKDLQGVLREPTILEVTKAVEAFKNCSVDMQKSILRDVPYVQKLIGEVTHLKAEVDELKEQANSLQENCSERMEYIEGLESQIEKLSGKEQG